jgi:hypothetical protein
MNNFIKVSQQRFFEIFADAKYNSRIQKLYEWTSCPYYDVVDLETNLVVGVYSDGSWENTFEVIPSLASKNDIINHYEELLKHKQRELERVDKHRKELQAYKNLSPKRRLLEDKRKKAKAQWRKTHPGLIDFLKDENILKYDIKEFNVGLILEAIKDFNNE